MKLPKGGLAAVVRELVALRVPLYAANAGFFLLLSVFPGLLLVLELLRATPLAVEDLLELVENLLPSALVDPARELVVGAWQNTGYSALGISALAAVWSASRGMQGVVLGLNAVYGLTESRGYLRNRLLSLGYTFAFFPVLMLTLMLHGLGSGIIGLLTMVDDPVVIFLVDHINLRFFLLLLLQTGVFALMYLVLPDGSGRFQDCLPGALLAAAGWQLLSELYSVYAVRAAAYTHVYGPVYAVALGMLWLYLCMSILFYGGALNRYFTENPGENIAQL